MNPLGEYLETAEVLHWGTFQKRSSYPSYLVILAGGVGVLAKPEDESGEGAVMVRREAAAWVVARQLGWCDLVSSTVLRRLPSFSGAGPAAMSLQVLWPDNLPDAPLEVFPEDDVLRAAVFDAIVGQGDRDGHNWLAVPSAGPQVRLKLVDHGYAFREDVARPNSTFFTRKEGEDLPRWITERVSRVIGGEIRSRLLELLPEPACIALENRAKDLIDRAVLQVG
jgi:hypothetical protein